MQIMKTIDLMKQLENVQFLSPFEARVIAKSALEEYSHLATESDAVYHSLFNMRLAEGCPNAVYNAVSKLIDLAEKNAA
jgi:hypothetical protein